MRRYRIDERRRVDKETFIEILNHAKRGQMFNICYADSISLRKFYRTDNPDIDIESFLDLMDKTGNEGMWGATNDRIKDYFKDPSSRLPNAKSKKSTQHTFGFNDFSLLKIRTLTLQWQGIEGYNGRYHNLKGAEDELLKKYPNISPERMKSIRGNNSNVGSVNTGDSSIKRDKSKQSYGAITKINKKTGETIKNSRGDDAMFIDMIAKDSDFETIGAKSEWFIVRDGEIVEKVPERAIKALITKSEGGTSDKYFGKNPNNKSLGAAIKELNDEEKEFERDIKSLDKDNIFLSFRDDKIVYVRLSSSDEFINSNGNEKVVWVNEDFPYDSMGLSDDAFEFLIKRGTRDVKESNVRFMRKTSINEIMNRRAVKMAVNEAVERYIYGY